MDGTAWLMVGLLTVVLAPTLLTFVLVLIAIVKGYEIK